MSRVREAQSERMDAAEVLENPSPKMALGSVMVGEIQVPNRAGNGGVSFEQNLEPIRRPSVISVARPNLQSEEDVLAA